MLSPSQIWPLVCISFIKHVPDKPVIGVFTPCSEFAQFGRERLEIGHLVSGSLFGSSGITLDNLRCRDQLRSWDHLRCSTLQGMVQYDKNDYETLLSIQLNYLRNIMELLCTLINI